MKKLIISGNLTLIFYLNQKYKFFNTFPAFWTNTKEKVLMIDLPLLVSTANPPYQEAVYYRHS